ncbi:MAG: polyprenyl synthetase family protein [Desulfurococcales archaeon]|nr:polyprenyl synthetase family protein [Desulfurococcales archaeon]
MESYSNLAKALEKYPSLIDLFIYKELVKGSPEHLYEASLHLIRAGGKRLRPIITLAVARMLGGQEAESKALPLAVATEVFHTFTLIHDDIMDQDEMRRGVKTVHKVWGEPVAILAGDLLFGLSYKSILLARQRGLSDKQIRMAVEALTEASIRVSQGQAYDMRFEEEEEVDYHDYLNMIYLKTGALIETSAKLGGIAANAPMPIIERLGEYGAFVGIAFQIRDDILGVYGDPKKTGKPVFNDLRRGKKTILVLYALKHSHGEDREILARILKGNVEDEELLRRTADIIKETGALDYAIKLAQTYSQNAISIIEDIESSGLVEDQTHANILKELARFSIEREK